MERRLAAILAADVVGYSRLMGMDEAGTLRRLKALRRDLVQPKIAEHKGRVVKLMGDGLLAEFPSVVEAVQCAARIQEEIGGRDPGASEAERIRLRIGVNLGDVIVEGSDIYGDGVNVAARLESLAEPGGVCISSHVFDAVDGKLALAFEDIGAQKVKNIAKPVHVYRLALAGGPAPTERAAGPFQLPDRPSIAVLPFTNMSGDREQEYFSDGITEDIITELSRFRTLFVIARNSSFAFKGRSENVKTIARELGVKYIVEGSVRKSGSRVRITAQLIEADSGNHLWAERYDRDMEDIFAVQDEVTQAIAAALPGRVDAAAVEQGRRRPTESLTAYDFLLRGEWLLRRGNFDDDEAFALFRRAVEIDPESARIHARIAAWHAYSVFNLDAPTEAVFRDARAHAERALALDDRDATVHAVAATVYLFLGEFALSEAHIERAMALNPNDVEVLYRRGMTAVYLGEPGAGIDWLKKAMRLDPFYPESRFEILFDGYYMAGDYAAAVEVSHKWRNPPIHMYAEFAAAFAQLGDAKAAERARARYEEMRAKDRGISEFAARHLRICKTPSDRDHWLEGYRKAGFSV